MRQRALRVAAAAVVLFVFAPAVCAAASAEEKNTEAIRNANEGNLGEALRLFTEAVELQPARAQFRNNLGVTYMRVGQLAAAREAFEMALTLEPGHVDAIDNLRELEEFERQEDGHSSAAPSSVRKRTPKTPPGKKRSSAASHYRGDDAEEDDSIDEPEVSQTRPLRASPVNVRHTVRKLPRVHISELYEPENIEFASGSRPFILTGVMTSKRGWPKRPVSAWSLDSFSKKYPDATVDFYPHNMMELDVHPYLVPMSTAVQETLNPSGKFPIAQENPGTYIQWNLKYADWAELSNRFGELPPLFTSDDAWLKGCLGETSDIDSFMTSTHWRMMLITTHGGGMFNHIDTLRTSSWQVQLLGTKRWHLCDRDQGPYLYIQDGVDAFHPDYDQFPDFLKANCFLDELKQGEAMYYPPDWYHQTVAVTKLAVSVTGTLVTPQNYRLVHEQLNRDCYTHPRAMRPTEATCAKLINDCFDWWQAAYDGKWAPAAPPGPQCSSR